MLHNLIKELCVLSPMSKPLRKTHNILKIINSSLIDLPSPSNINIIWNFGSLLGLCLMFQLLTGIFLSIHYCSDTFLAFDSTCHISRDVLFGWLIRSFHANGASLFFLCMYFHIGRGLYYSSFTFEITWKHWSYYLPYSNNNCFFRLCFTLRANILLGCHSNHKPSIYCSIYWPSLSPMSLRGLRSR